LNVDHTELTRAPTNCALVGQHAARFQSQGWRRIYTDRLQVLAHGDPRDKIIVNMWNSVN